MFRPELMSYRRISPYPLDPSLIPSVQLDRRNALFATLILEKVATHSLQFFYFRFQDMDTVNVFLLGAGPSWRLILFGLFLLHP
jgi:hypothetical protein